MVKTTMFNGVPLPSIMLWDSDDNSLQMIKSFSYDDFEGAPLMTDISEKPSGWETQFLGEELSKAENNEAAALFHVLPFGLEKTVSYGSGTANGPAAIIEASHQLKDGWRETSLADMVFLPPQKLTVRAISRAV